MPSFRHCLRIANKVRNALEFHIRSGAPLWLWQWQQLEQIVERLRSSRRQVDVARNKLWSASVRHGLDVQLAHLVNLQKLLQETRESLSKPPPTLPSLADLIADLTHLEQEFDEPTIDWSDGFLAVETEPIVLQGVHLGPFSIRLYWDRLKEQVGVECFDVVALESHPANINEDYTHPHVNDNRLCVGEAADALERAVREGRLMDAFLLIRNVLLTYNPRSAYAQLDTWEGTSCDDCGQMIDEDDLRVCSACESDYCADCISYCSCCYESLCDSCSNHCQSCEDVCCQTCLCQLPVGQCCRSCLRHCSKCACRVAKGDRDESEQCPACQEAQDETDSNPEMEVTHEVA